MIIKGSSVSVRCTKYIWTLEVVSYRFYNHYTVIPRRLAVHSTQTYCTENNKHNMKSSNQMLNKGPYTNPKLCANTTQVN